MPSRTIVAIRTALSPSIHQPYLSECWKHGCYCGMSLLEEPWKGGVVHEAVKCGSQANLGPREVLGGWFSGYTVPRG